MKPTHPSIILKPCSFKGCSDQIEVEFHKNHLLLIAKIDMTGNTFKLPYNDISERLIIIKSQQKA